MGFLNRLFLFHSDVLRSESDIFLNAFFEELIFRELEDKANVLAKAFDVFGSFFFYTAIDETIDVDGARGWVNQRIDMLN